MSKVKKVYHTMDFKIRAAKYCKKHTDMSVSACAKVFDVPVSTLQAWVYGRDGRPGILDRVAPPPTTATQVTLVDEPSVADEIALLKEELRTKQDALDLLKRVINLLAKD